MARMGKLTRISAPELIELVLDFDCMRPAVWYLPATAFTIGSIVDFHRAEVTARVV